MKKCIALLLLLSVILMSAAPAQAASGWLTSDAFTLRAAQNGITADWSGISLTGDVWIFYYIEGNPFYYYHRCAAGSGQYTFIATPGTPYIVSLYNDQNSTGKAPNWNMEGTYRIKLKAAAQWQGIDYTLTDSGVFKYLPYEAFPGLRQIAKVSAIKSSDIGDDSKEVSYRWKMKYRIDQEKKIKMVFLLTAPEGYRFNSSVDLTLPAEAPDSYITASISGMLESHASQKNSRLTGKYTLDVYVNSGYFDTVVFNVGSEDVKVNP